MQIEENVIVLPKISDQNLLARFYSMADAFVICSKRENFPTTCIEAQCCGTPVVGFDTGGTRETSLFGENDFVEYGDIDALARKVDEVLHRDCSNLALDAHHQYSKEVMYKHYLDEYGISNTKKRILLVDVNCKFSSTGKIVYDLMHNLQQDGHEAAVCYGRGELVQEQNIYKFGLDWETRLHALLARITGYNGCFSPLSTRRLIKFIDEYKPDVIHIHELHAYFVNIEPFLDYIKRKNIKVVWTFHCEYMYTGKCGHANDCNRFQNGCGNCPNIKGYPKSLMFDKTHEMFEMKKRCLTGINLSIVTPSKWLSDRVGLSFLQNVQRNVIHNGINTSIFSPIESQALRDRLGIPPKNKVVLALAPNIMSEDKGGHWVVELAKRMREQDILFVLVGDTLHQRGVDNESLIYG